MSLNQTQALIVVDVQPTFCEGGELPVEGGNETAANIATFLNEHRSDYRVVVSSQDWHIDPGHHFADEPDFIDTWPAHGVADTPTAELHPALPTDLIDDQFKKGHQSAAYSAFEGINADGELLETALEGIASVDIVGIALSHCVKETALQAKELGFNVRVFLDLTVPVTKELGDLAILDLREAGVVCGTYRELTS